MADSIITAILLDIHNDSKLPNDIFGDINRKYIYDDLSVGTK